MSTGPRDESAPVLNAEERAAIDYLRADWQRLFHVTTVPQALGSLGTPTDERARWRLAAHLRARQDSLPPVQQWGLAHFALTELEKSLGRHLAVAAPAGRGRLPLADLSAALHCPSSWIGAAAAALQRLELVDHAVDGDQLVWTFRAAWRRRLGPLGFTWHTLARASGERFGVP